MRVIGKGKDRIIIRKEKKKEWERKLKVRGRERKEVGEQEEMVRGRIGMKKGNEKEEKEWKGKE